MKLVAAAKLNKLQPKALHLKKYFDRLVTILYQIALQKSSKKPFTTKAVTLLLSVYWWYRWLLIGGSVVHPLCMFSEEHKRSPPPLLPR